MNTRITLLSITVLIAVAATFFLIRSDGNGDALQSPSEQLSAPGPEASGSKNPFRRKDIPTPEVDVESVILADLDHLKLPADLDREIADIEQELARDSLDVPVTPWTISAVIPENAIPLEEKIQSREPVTLDPGQAAEVAVGDVIQLPLPGTSQYQAVVDRVSVGDNGETNWTGYLQGYDTDYPVVFTLGAQSGFATITTPEGQYAMEAVDGSGWVYKTPELIDLVDPDQPDFLITDGTGHPE